MPDRQLLNSINLQGGIDASAPQLSPESQATLAEHCWNLIVSGNGFTKPFSGAASEGGGSYKMLPFGKTWGGIRVNGVTPASGSYFLDIGQSRWGVGSGIPMIEGADVSGWALSTNLQLQIASGGTYASPVQAGLAQPSAPSIGIVDSPGDISNAMSCKIERSRPSTGANSLASPTSAVVTPVANQLYVTFPVASSGQTHWRVFFTFQGFGGNGVHYLALYAGASDIPEATVAAGTVSGIARSLQFNFKDGDLVPLEASFDDYPPPAATHALRLQSVLNLAGCYADSTASPTSGNPGTAIAVSKENNYESYVPTSLLFLPEPVVDTLSRPIDDYGYVACENSVHALQYVGPRDNMPSCTITTILPDVGIQYPFNWCTFGKELALYTAAGNLWMMDENGGWDTEFAGPVTRLLKAYFPNSSTSVMYDPKNDAVVVMSGSRALVWSRQKRVWRQVWLGDYGIAGNAQAGIAAKRTLYFSMNNAGTYSAYSWDNNTTPAPMCVVSNYQTVSHLAGYQMVSGGTVHDITQMSLAVEPPGAGGSVAVVINRNLRKTVMRRITAVSLNATVTDVEASVQAWMLHKTAILIGTNIGGVGVHFLKTKVTAVPANNLLTLLNAPQTSITNCLMLIGDWGTVTQSLTVVPQHIRDFFPYIKELRSHQVAVAMYGTLTGNALGAGVLGNQYSSARAL